MPINTIPSVNGFSHGTPVLGSSGLTVNTGHSQLLFNGEPVGGGNQVWPTGGAGIPNYNGASGWGTTYSVANPIPQNFLTLPNYYTTAGTWTAAQQFNGGIVAPSGQSIQVSDFASAAAGFQVTSFGSATVYSTSQNGNAMFNLNTNALGGFFAGAPFSGNAFTMGYTGSNGLGFTDSIAGDSLITAVSGKSVRIGVGTGNSTMQVSNSNVTVPSQKSTTGTRYACFDTSGNLISSATPCAGT
jgi:hypothetical protein